MVSFNKNKNIILDLLHVRALFYLSLISFWFLVHKYYIIKFLVSHSYIIKRNTRHKSFKNLAEKVSNTYDTIVTSYRRFIRPDLNSPKPWWSAWNSCLLHRSPKVSSQLEQPYASFPKQIFLFRFLARSSIARPSSACSAYRGRKPGSPWISSNLRTDDKHTFHKNKHREKFAYTRKDVCIRRSQVALRDKQISAIHSRIWIQLAWKYRVIVSDILFLTN